MQHSTFDLMREKKRTEEKEKTTKYKMKERKEDIQNNAFQN